MVSAGQIDQPIRVERATRAANEFGEAAITAWTLIASPFAHVITPQGREIVAGKRDGAASAVVFRVRDGLDITTADRIVWAGLAFNVLGVHPKPRQGELLIEAMHVNGSAGA